MLVLYCELFTNRKLPPLSSAQLHANMYNHGEYLRRVKGKGWRGKIFITNLKYKIYTLKASKFILIHG